MTVTQPTALTASTSASSDPNCNGGSDGSISFAANGGTSAYTYSIGTGNQGNGTFTGLSAGSYTVTITDANGCVASSSTVTLSDPAAISLSAAQTVAISCAGFNDGQANATASGGTGSLSYLWSDGQNTATATNLAAGTYTVTVTDANGCNSTSSVSLTDPAGMASAAGVTSSYNGADISCFGATDGELTASVSGGNAWLFILWSDGQTNAIASGLSDGSYTVTITDQSGCTTVSTASVNQPTQLSLNSTSTPTLCNGDANGSVIAAAGGGTGTYTYNIGAGNQASSTFTGLSAGNYTVSVTDVNGCLATSTVTVTQPTALTASTSASSDPNCNGGSDGSISFAANGGTSAYTYSIGTGNQGNGTFTGLSAGSYTVTITDANGCVASSSTVTLSDPAAISLSAAQTVAISCAGFNDGQANATASGGTGSLSYLWSDGQNTATATNLAAGTYTVTVTDANGCNSTSSVSLTDPAGMASAAGVTSSYNGADISCFGATDGELTASVSGGTPGYSFLWSDGQTNAIASGLSDGSYTVTITDQSGCTTVSTASVNQPTQLSLNSTSTPTLCNGDANGSVIAAAGGGTGTYTYNIGAGNQASSTFTGLSAGNYTVSVTDVNGCLATSTVTVTQPTALTASTSASSDRIVMVVPMDRSALLRMEALLHILILLAQVIRGMVPSLAFRLGRIPSPLRMPMVVSLLRVRLLYRTLLPFLCQLLRLSLFLVPDLMTGKRMQLPLVVQVRSLISGLMVRIQLRLLILLREPTQ